MVDMRQLNVSAADQQAILNQLKSQSTPEENFIVMPENAPALFIFLDCESQWRTGMQGHTGLDYTAVIAVIKLRAKKKQRAELFNEVKLIEQGALKAIRRLRTKHGSRKRV